MPRVGEDVSFRRYFGFCVNAQRVRLGAFIVVARPAVKDQISREKDERNGGGQLREAGGHLDVQFSRQGGILLTRRTATQRRAMDDESWSLLVEHSANGVEFRQVELIARET